MSDKEALKLCIRVMKSVTYCFDSVHDMGVTDVKHPSCNELLHNTIDEVEGREHEENTRRI